MFGGRRPDRDGTANLSSSMPLASMTQAMPSTFVASQESRMWPRLDVGAWTTGTPLLRMELARWRPGTRPG
jgi:hypothetical protein